MSDNEIDQAKDDIRRRVWDLLDSHDVGRTGPVHGKIPNFAGADAAARRLAELKSWQAARVVKANPDKAQVEVRTSVLQAGRLLYMAVPKLATEQPFYELDPQALDVPYPQAATGRGAAEHASSVGVERMRPVDVVVCGSVAVNREGARVGKGAGYSDIEVALLTEAGFVGPKTLILTTVHGLQVVDEPLPETRHDFRVDVIVTPDEVIDCPPATRPTGLVWDDLSDSKIAAIPALQRALQTR